MYIPRPLVFFVIAMKGKHLSQPQLALYQSSSPTPFWPTMLARTSSRLPLLLHLDTNASLMNVYVASLFRLFTTFFLNLACLFRRQNSNFHAKILFPLVGTINTRSLSPCEQNVPSCFRAHRQTPAACAWVLRSHHTWHGDKSRDEWVYVLRNFSASRVEISRSTNVQKIPRILNEILIDFDLLCGRCEILLSYFSNASARYQRFSLSSIRTLLKPKFLSRSR